MQRACAVVRLTRVSTQMEERGEDPQPVEFPDVWPAVQRAQKSFVREQAVRLCRRGLQKLVLATQERRTAHRMLKSASRVCAAAALADTTATGQRFRRQSAERRRAGGSWKRRAGVAPPLLVRQLRDEPCAATHASPVAINEQAAPSSAHMSWWRAASLSCSRQSQQRRWSGRSLAAARASLRCGRPRKTYCGQWWFALAHLQALLPSCFCDHRTASPLGSGPRRLGSLQGTSRQRGSCPISPMRGFLRRTSTTSKFMRGLAPWKATDTHSSKRCDGGMHFFSRFPSFPCCFRLRRLTTMPPKQPPAT